MAGAAQQLGEDDFCRNKLATARFFASKLLPEVHSLCAGIEQQPEDFMDIPAALI